MTTEYVKLKFYLLFVISEILLVIDETGLIGSSDGDDLVRVQVGQVFGVRENSEHRLLNSRNL